MTDYLHNKNFDQENESNLTADPFDIKFIPLKMDDTDESPIRHQVLIK